LGMKMPSSVFSKFWPSRQVIIISQVAPGIQPRHSQPRQPSTEEGTHFLPEGDAKIAQGGAERNPGEAWQPRPFAAEG
jgi:hypothetical protein